MKLRVDVTADDIRLGKKASFCNCPLARAIKRTLKATTVEVDPSDGAVTADGLSLEFGSDVTTFVERFDNDKAVKPRSFTFGLNG